MIIKAMKTVKITLIVTMALVIISACEENEPNIPQAATIRLVNAIQDIGTIDLRRFEGSISFFSANTIAYGNNVRFTIPSNKPTSLMIAPASDTSDIRFSEAITPDRAGGIYSLFLHGDSIQVESFMIKDEFTNYRDSIFGARFINLSADSEPVTIRGIAMDSAGVRDTTVIASDIAFQSITPFSRFEVTNSIENHTFQYVDAGGNVLASVIVPQFSFFDPPYFKNLTLTLIGRTDDGEGGNNLSIAMIEHFE